MLLHNIIHIKKPRREAWLLSLLVEHGVRLFAGDGTLEGELSSLEIYVGRTGLYALTCSSFGCLSTGKINSLRSFCRTGKQDDLVISHAEHSAAYCGKVVCSFGNVLNNAFIECTNHRRMICQYSDIAISKRNQRIACHRVTHYAVGRCDLKMDLICHSSLPKLIALCDDVVYRAAQQERLLRNIVAFSAEYCLEAADCVLKLYILALNACEVLCNVERL